jgi:hypothetical protein
VDRKHIKRLGRHSTPINHELSNEILTSLPGIHVHTHELAPDQVPDEPFDEIRTGQDDDKSFSKVHHILMGLLAWAGIIGWTVYIWISSPMALTDLVLALGLWVLTFLFTIIGVPFVRRKARNRANHD